MSSHGGWTEFANYTVGGSAVRGTASFSAATSTGTTPTNVTTKTASAITYTITGGGATLKVGELLSALVQLIVSFVIVVFTIGFLRTYFLSKIGAARTA
jgi:hypothetical protein